MKSIVDYLYKHIFEDEVKCAQYLKELTLLLVDNPMACMKVKYGILFNDYQWNI